MWGVRAKAPHLPACLPASRPPSHPGLQQAVSLLKGMDFSAKARNAAAAGPSSTQPQRLGVAAAAAVQVQEPVQKGGGRRGLLQNETHGPLRVSPQSPWAWPGLRQPSRSTPPSPFSVKSLPGPPGAHHTVGWTHTVPTEGWALPGGKPALSEEDGKCRERNPSLPRAGSR